MWIVASDENISRFGPKSIGHPRGRIFRLQIPGDAELRKRVAHAQEDLGRLLGAQLPAVPDHDRSRAMRGYRRGDTLCVKTPDV